MIEINWDELRRAALSARKNAYAPYSLFKVGAAIKANGKIFVGCNVENVSYPVGMCAERAAIAAAVAAGCTNLEAICIAANKPISPCGMCRQALTEFNEQIPLLFVGKNNNDKEVLSSLDKLLPKPFSL